MAASLCQGFWDDEQQTCQPAVSTTQTGVSGEDGIDKPSDTKGESTPTRKHDENPVTISASQAHTLPTSSVSFRNTLSNAASTASLTTDPLITSAPAPASAVSGGSGSNGVSKGAAAGIAIATAIVGGAIAFFVAFMLFKRRKRPSAHSFENHSTDFLTSLKGGNSPYVQVSQVIAPPPVAAAAIPRKRSLDLADLSNSSDFLAGILPPAADEQTVKDKVAALFSQVLQHVDNFYRDVQATLTPSMEVDLKKFGSESVNLAEILGLSSAPTVAIKHALMGYILSIVSPAAEPQSTLFPVEVAGLRDDERLTESPDDQVAYILYKRLAVHLHAPNTASLQSRQSDAREAAEHFSLTFFPWANPACNDQDKDDSLLDIIGDALDLSLWLYGQSYIYEFVWDGNGRRGTVLAPGLRRMTDERGRMCSTAKIVLDPVVATG